MVRKWKIQYKVNPDQIGVKTENIIDILLENRGVTTKKGKEDFLNPSLGKVTIDNCGIDRAQVQKTIKRILKAIEEKEKIIVYGDYDVDGISGAAILWETLFEFYKNVMPYIPHRVDEGYGLSKKGIEHLLKANKDVGLIITVDNGIVANDAVDFAKENGIDVVVTDHHVKGEKVPRALSIVHTTKLCGAGVAYLLSQEIKNQKSSASWRIKNQSITEHLELVALATVADLVPLTGVNRALVKFGIEALKKTQRPGLIELYNEAGIKAADIGVYEIGHIIAPRLNAAGRITHALDSLRLLCTKDKKRALELAQYLGEINRERQMLTQESTEHADIASKQILNQKFIFVHDPNYNQGVIGLVASRLVESYFRPAVVISEGKEFSKGSARSISGFNIIEFLRTFSHMLIDAGGHPMAAGFTVETSKIEMLKKAVLRSAEEVIGDHLLEKILKIDLELDFNQINPELYENIKSLAPFGMGNPEPVFVSRNVKVEGLRFVGQENKHLKIKLSQDGKMFDCIFFSVQETNLQIGQNLEVVYGISRDEWNGVSKIQLKIKDIRYDH